MHLSMLYIHNSIINSYLTAKIMAMASEIVVVPFPHPGHLFPATELCNHLAARQDLTVTVFFPSSSSSSSLHPLVNVVQLPLHDSVNFKRDLLDQTLLHLIGDYLADRRLASLQYPVCAIVDEMISWAMEPFVSVSVPVIAFFTSSACSSALSHALDKLVDPETVRLDKAIRVAGLPEEMALTTSSLAARHRPPPMQDVDGGLHGRHRPNGMRPRRGLASTDRVAAMLYNTCAELERTFIYYVAGVAGKPVWGVGPLIRSKAKGLDTSKNEIIKWLDSKAPGSVVYVSFGSLVNPADEELEELAVGLEESNRPFIWVVQANARQHDSAGRPIEGNGSVGFVPRVGTNRDGLVIRGWAPQLSILSHPSTGGYVCHCGWNSTLEALGCGVPMLTWPVRGDQHHNAKLVTSLLKVGVPVKDGDVAVNKGMVTSGIERLMNDEEMKARAKLVRSVFEGGFPKSSSDAIDEFLKFARKKQTH